MFKALYSIHTLKSLFTLVLCLNLIACGGGGGSSAEKAPEPTLDSIELSGLSNSVLVGESQQLSVSARYSDNSSEDISTQVSWSSSNESIATVSGTGLLQALSAGSANITASLNNLTQTAQVDVVALNAIEVSSISSNLGINDTQQLTATGTYTDTSTTDISSEVSWSSSNDSVLSVSDLGVITVHTAGTATITASLNGVEASSSTTIIILNSLSVSALSSTIKAGITEQLTLTANYSNGSNVDVTNQANWNSSNSAVLSVSTIGLVTAVSKGVATISASFDGVMASTPSTVIQLENLSISNISTTLQPGDSQQLSVTGTYSDSSTEDMSDAVTWSSSNTGVANISDSGLLNIIGAGSSAISVTLDSLNDSDTVSIITLNSISISSPSNLKISETQQLSATGTYSDANTQDLSDSVTWTSTAPGIVSISSSGLITAISAGTTTINATLNSVNGNTSATAIELVSLSVSPSLLTLAINSSQQFVATGLYSDNSTEDLSSSATWSSDNTSVATISASGELTSVASGTANIEAAINTINNAIEVTVSPATLQAIEINAPSTIAAGTSTQLNASGTYSDGSTQDLTDTVSWSSSNNSIASINSESGELTSITQGSVTVSATNNGLLASTTIEISPAILTDIVITPTTLFLANGSNEQVSITAFFSDNTHQDISDQVTWESSDTLVATANANALVQSTGLGSNTLTASFSGFSSELQVTVTNAALTQISILPIDSSIPKGMSQTFSASGLYTDGSVQDLSAQVTWLSDDEDVSTINNNIDNEGLASGIELGTATITAVLGDISATTSLTVDNAILNSIDVQPTSKTIAKGVDIQGSATGHYSDGSKIDITDLVNWSSSNANIANVSSENPGLINSIDEGVALISTNLDGKTGLAQITVTAATLQSIVINVPETTLPKGTEQTLTATGHYSDSSTNDISQQVTWQSSDNNILTVDNSDNNIGLLRAESEGTASVSASISGVSTNATITVTSATLSQITVSLNSDDININEEAQATAIATFSDTSTQDLTQQVNWSSSNSSIASINNQTNKGLVTGISEGSSNLTASLNGISSTSQAIQVRENPNLPGSISLDIVPNVIINNGTDSTSIQATVLPAIESGTIADGTEVTFTITEGETARIETATTVSGIASISSTSTFEGLISIEANINNSIDTNAGLLSTDDLSDVIITQAQSQAVYENNKLLAGSIIALLTRNFSNRDFTINMIGVLQGVPSAGAHLPGSPITDPLYTSDGTLSGGEFTAFGYQFDNDVENNLFTIFYDMTDPISNTDLTIGTIFGFE